MPYNPQTPLQAPQPPPKTGLLGMLEQADGLLKGGRTAEKLLKAGLRATRAGYTSAKPLRGYRHRHPVNPIGRAGRK